MTLEEKAREAAEKIIAEVECIMVGGCPACPGYHPENRCEACQKDAATIAARLTEWGQQVQRETVTSGAEDLDACTTRDRYNKCGCGSCACGAPRHSGMHGPAHGELPGSRPWGHAFVREG